MTGFISFIYHITRTNAEGPGVCAPPKKETPIVSGHLYKRSGTPKVKVTRFFTSHVFK